MAETGKIYIKKLDIISFGGIKNFTIDLTDGFNLIYGKNESGKSTLNLFIKAMFYGLQTRKRSGEALKERERAIPWNEKKAEGKILLSHNERDIEIIRVFGKRASDDKTEARSFVSGENLSSYEINDPGRYIFGISEEMFLKTCYVSQGNAFMGGKDEEITRRLINLETGGDEDISADSAIACLDAFYAKLRAKDGRSKRGELDELEQRLSECMREKEIIFKKEEETRENKDRLSETEASLKNTEEEIGQAERELKNCVEYEKLSAKKEKLKQIENIDRKTSEAEKEYEKIRELTEETVDEAKKKEQEIQKIIYENQRDDLRDERDANIEKNLAKGKKFCVTGGVLAGASVIGIMLSAMIAKSFPGVIGCALTAVLGVVLLIFGITADRNAKIEKIKIDNVKSDLNKRREENLKTAQNLQKELDAIFLKYEVKNTDELYRLFVRGEALLDTIKNNKKARADFLGEDDEEKLKAEMAEFEEVPQYEGKDSAYYENRLRILRSRQLQLTTEQQNIKNLISEAGKNSMSVTDIETEISAINDRTKECERKIEVVGIAKRVLSDTATRWKENFTPALCFKVNEIMGALTSGKYDDIKVQSDFGMVFGKDGKIYEAEYLSRGTYEQIYLALRLAVFKLTCESGILFLDDVLTTYDEERAEAAIKYLNSKVNMCQTVVFTCHNVHKDMANRFDANIINLEN